MRCASREKSRFHASGVQSDYERLVTDLNSEIDRLSCQNRTLSETLSRTEDKVAVERSNERDLENHNQQLLNELCQLSKENSDLKLNVRSQLETVTHENNHLRAQLADVQRVREDTTAEMSRISMERSRLEQSLSDTQQQNLSTQQNTRDMRTLVFRLEDDKKRLAQRIEKLSGNERALVLELERIKRHGSHSSVSSKAKGVSRLEQHLSGIEADRDYWRNQVELMQQMLAYPSLVSRTGSGTRTSGSRVKNKPPVGQNTGRVTNKASRETSQNRLESQIRDLRTDRDRLRRELDRMNRSPVVGSSTLTRSRSLSRLQNRDETMELSKLRQERDDLRTMLNKLEERVQEARCEIHRLHQDLFTMQENGDRTCQTTQSVLRRAEAERDRSLVDLSRVQAERDSLITKYKHATENANADNQRLTKQLDQLERSLSQRNRERDEATRRLSDLRQRVEEQHTRQTQLEENLEERQDMYKKTSEEATLLRNELNAQRNLVDEKTEECAQLNERSRVLEIEVRRVRERADDVESRFSKSREDAGRMTGQISQLQDDAKCLQYDLEKSNMERADLLKQQRQMDKRIQSMSSDCDRLSHQLREVDERRGQLEEKLSIAERDNADHVAKAQIEKASGEELQKRLDAALYSKSTAERRSTWYEQQCSELQTALGQSERHCATEKERNKWLTEGSEKLSEDNKALRATVELANKDKGHLEACIEDMTVAHRQAVREREELVQRAAIQRERIMELEDKCKQIEHELSRTTEAQRMERNNTIELQGQLDQARRRCDTTDSEAATLAVRLRECEDQFHKSETRIAQLDRELRAEREDYGQLRARMDAVDEEKQTLEIALRDTNQRLTHLEIDLSSRNREVNELRQANEETSRALSRTQETLSTKTSELTCNRGELSAVQANLIETKRLLEAEERESGRLREELNQVARDAQTLQTELQDVGEDREELKQRSKGYLIEITRQERALSDRDAECAKLMEQVRVANDDMESWRQRWEAAENKLGNTRQELEERESEMAMERDRADAREREVTHLRACLNSTELQNSTTSRAAAEATEQLQMARAELDTLATELGRLRDNLTRLESERALAQRESSSQRVENDQLRAQLDDFELELEQIKEQLDQERLNNRNLQTSLQSGRQKEQNALMELQERTTEAAALRERISNVEERADGVQRESERLRDRLVESERETHRLSRSLSAERFEKERALSEIRLSTLPAGYRPSGYTSYSTGLHQSSTLPHERLAYRERDADF